MSSSFPLSDEQQAILQQAKPPNSKSSIVRITSAAGTGKTTTLLKLAEKCAHLGHTNITYITFNKSAAADARARLEKTENVSVDARTLHSCAMSLLAKQANETEAVTAEEFMMSDEVLQREISRIAKRDIESFLSDCYAELDKRYRNNPRTQQSMKRNAEKQVGFFIFKTLKMFCQSNLSEQEWTNGNDRKRNYYPAVMYHKRGGDGEKAGFVEASYEQKVSFYASQACKLWTNEMKRIKSYDFEMKRAQLLNLEIPGTILLVDECQDMDGCQVSWVAAQAQHFPNKQLFFVGDAAQTIYSFRGAKSKFMMNLPGKVTDCTLTKSWRFGPKIAHIANLVLYAKEKSPQTTGNYVKTWQPYRVVGAASFAGKVTDESLLPHWKTQPVTLLAHANVALLVEAVGMLGFTPSPKEDDEDGTEEAVVAPPPTPFDPSMIPKFHVNGRGENSGMKKWKQVLKQIEHLHTLYMSGETGYSLPPAMFPEFANEQLTWDDLVEQVKNRELNRYAASIQAVGSFQKDTMTAIGCFEENVMDKNYSAEEADIVLSTCHAAKGMEWDHVQVVSDFCNLACVNNEGPKVSTAVAKKKQHPYAKKARREDGRKSWQFAFKNYGDDVNLLYVACTRAKKTLSVPQAVKKMVQDCDLLCELLNAKTTTIPVKSDPDAKEETGTVALLGSKKAMNPKDLQHLMTDLIAPLRTECKIHGKQSLEDALFSHQQCGALKQENAVESHSSTTESMVRETIELLDASDDDCKMKIPAVKSNATSHKTNVEEVIVLDDTPEKVQSVAKRASSDMEVVVID